MKLWTVEGLKALGLTLPEGYKTRDGRINERSLKAYANDTQFHRRVALEQRLCTVRYDKALRVLNELGVLPSK